MYVYVDYAGDVFCAVGGGFYLEDAAAVLSDAEATAAVKCAYDDAGVWFVAADAVDDA